MALYFELPVYSASYKLTKQVFLITQNFAREYKYTIGQDLKNECTNLTKLIYRANKNYDKIAIIEEAKETVEVIRLQIRLMKDFNQLGIARFIEVNESIEDISKQFSNWLNYQKKTKEKNKIPPELSVTRVQTGERSKSNSPLIYKTDQENNISEFEFERNLSSNTGIPKATINAPVSGNRNRTNGSMNNVGSNGNYWSSSIDGSNARNLNFNSSGVNTSNSNNRANGLTVRCIKDLHTKFPIQDLFHAYYCARKNKRNTENALRYELNYEQNLFALYDAILHKNYKIKPSTVFIVNYPVKREIFAADFEDRIVHHLIFNYLNPIFEKNFINDSYSCRIGKGTSYGIKRAKYFLASCSDNYKKDCYVLKLDIKGYFMSINKDILYEEIYNRLNSVKNSNFDKQIVLYLVENIVFNDPTINFTSKSKSFMWLGLPKSKSLFFADERKGLPIGNLTSQLFANIYLDKLDHFIKKNLNIKYYGRYVDDMIFINCNKESLKEIMQKINIYLSDQLELAIHPKKVYLQHYSKGVKFLGTYIMPRRIYIEKRIKRNAYRTIVSSDIKNIDESISKVNSYLGLMKQYNTYKLRKSILSNLSSDLKNECIFSENYDKINLNNKVC